MPLALFLIKSMCYRHLGKLVWKLLCLLKTNGEMIMLELIFILVFAATLLVTGITMVTVFAATGIALVVMFLLGMVGAVLKLLPWLIVIALGVWFFKNYVAQPRYK